MTLDTARHYLIDATRADVTEAYAAALTVARAQLALAGYIGDAADLRLAIALLTHSERLVGRVYERVDREWARLREPPPVLEDHHAGTPLWIAEDGMTRLDRALGRT